MPKTIATLALLLTSVATCPAKDAIEASVTASDRSPIVVANGNPYSQGTYAVGTIQLFYTVVADSFPVGDFATFRVDMTDLVNYSGGQSTDYSSVALQLEQAGSSNLTLTPVPYRFSPLSPGWSGQSIVTISIPASAAADTTLTELLGNLKINTDPAGAHLDTVTNVQVHIRLVHPTPGACLNVLPFITDQGLTTAVSSLDVNTNKSKVTSTGPSGQLSDNVLVVNTCGTPQSFDLKIGLDSSFATNPEGNPGNAVFTYLTTGVVDVPTFLATVNTLTGSPQGQQLCLANVTVQPGQTFMATVHMGILRGLATTALPKGGTFSFSDQLRVPATPACTGGLDGLAAPNPAPLSVSFTVK